MAASILTAVYYRLRDGVAYRDLGADHFPHCDEGKIAQRLARRIKDLGYEVDLRQVA